MSLKAWKKKYYPKEASEVGKGLAAIKHSLRKWEGLRKGVLRKFEVKSEFGNDHPVIHDEEESLEININSCALCFHYYYYPSSCLECPLYNFLEGRCDEGKGSPYMKYFFAQDPEPMIAALKGTLKKFQEDGKKKKKTK